MLKLFISYSRIDDSFRKKIETSLALLKRKNIINVWTDREILPGQNFSAEISANLEDADVIIPLLSFDFIDSDYCYNVEMVRALEKHDKGESLLVPIVIRPCSWRNSPFANFQLLPSEGKPISDWDNEDNAWLNVYEGIYNLCLSVIEQKKNKLITTDDNHFFKIGIFGETASGKSTLCNALIGREIMRVSDITPVTRTPQMATAKLNGRNIQFIDCPGIGESIEDDKRVDKIYNSLFKEVDFIIWVIRADIRNYSPDQKYIERIKNIDLGNKKFCIVLNMIDRIIYESQGWDQERNKPNKSLELSIVRKIMYVSGLFQILPNKLIPTVGFKSYNIDSLLKSIIDSMTEIDTDANKGSYVMRGLS